MKRLPACRALIIGDTADPHVQAVLDRCAHPGLVIVNAADLSSSMECLSLDGVVIADVNGDPCMIGAPTSTPGWIRRLAPEDWDEHTVMGGQRAAAMAARMTLLGAVMRDPAVRWVTAVDALFAAENKIVQLRAARSLGLRVPHTMITADRLALATLGQPFVLKPLGPGHYVDADGTTQLVHASETFVEALAGVDVMDAPFLAQRRVQAQQHVRVVTIGDQAWPCSMLAHGLPLDWRSDRGAHDSFRHDPSLGSVAASAVSLAQCLGVGYSSQDWLIDDDGPVFLDLNPGGQWLFLPQPVAAEVTAALAARLNPA